jgi:hypothetical protein
MSRARASLLRAQAVLVGLLLPLGLFAQGRGCERPARVNLFEEAWFTYPELIASIGDEHFITGQRTIMTRVSPANELIARDTLVDGFIARGAKPTLAVTPLAEGRLMRSARIHALRGDSLQLLFEPSRDRFWASENRDSVEMWSATYAKGAWTRVRRVAALAPRTRLGRSFSSDAVHVDGRSIIAFISALPGRDADGVGFLHRRGDSTWVEYQDFQMLGGDYADLVVHEGVPWLAITAIVEERRFAGAYSSGASIWTSRFEDGHWTPLVRTIDGLQRSLREPRLVSTRAGLVLAWTEGLEVGQALRWQGLSPRGDTTTREVPSFVQSSRGNAPFSHVLAVTTESSATLFVPTPGGREVIARVQVAKGLPPMLGGSWEDPILLAIGPLNRPRMNVELVAYSLRCAIPALRVLTDGH